MDALNQGSAASFTSSAVSGPEPVSRPTHAVDPRDYEPPVSRALRYKSEDEYDVNSPWNYI